MKVFRNFRLISLHNVIYKILSKIITSRLRSAMNKLISPIQSTFVPCRWIIENSILAHEIIHNFLKRNCDKALIRGKLDMMKAYDRVEWGFILRVLELFSFRMKFVQLVSRYLTIVSFRILINKGPSITHLLFTNDIILFLKANLNDA